MHRTLEDDFRRGAELIVDMAMRNADAGVDARARAICERFSGRIDVLLDRTRERAHDGAIAHFSSDLLDALEIARRRNRETRLDDIDVETQ